MSKEQLPIKQQAFVEEYITNGFNAAAAYRIAYPLAKTGHRENGHRLITKDNIKAVIAKRKAELMAKTEWSTEISKGKYLEAAQIGIDIHQPAVAVTAYRNIDGLYGLQKADMAGREAVVIVIGPKPDSRPVVASQEAEDGPERLKEVE